MKSCPHGISSPQVKVLLLKKGHFGWLFPHTPEGFEQSLLIAGLRGGKALLSFQNHIDHRLRVQDPFDPLSVGVLARQCLMEPSEELAANPPALCITHIPFGLADKRACSNLLTPASSRASPATGSVRAWL